MWIQSRDDMIMQQDQALRVALFKLRNAAFMNDVQVLQLLVIIHYCSISGLEKSNPQRLILLQQSNSKFMVSKAPCHDTGCSDLRFHVKSDSSCLLYHSHLF